MRPTDRMAAEAAGSGSRSFGGSIACGLAVGAVASVALASVECLLGFALAPTFAWDGPWPVDLLLAAIGMQAVTQALIWVPLLTLCAVVYHTVVGRRTSSPLPFLAALPVALTGLFVLPQTLRPLLSEVPHGVLLTGVGSLVLAVGVYVALRICVARTGTWSKRSGRLLVVVCALAALTAGVAFARSPWLDPASYRVGAPSDSWSRPERPHVLLVVLDTVRPDRMSVHGYSRPTTPFLETFAQNAIVFDQAIADGTWTLPSHASMFTGTSVRRHGVGRVRSALDGDLPTLAETLAGNGYNTASFSNNPLISHHTKLDRGFDVSRVTSTISGTTNFSVTRALHRLGLPPPLPWLDPDRGAALTNHLIARWLDDEAPHDAPLFLFVNYMEAHLPWDVPASYRRRFMSDAQVRRSYELRRRAYGGIERALNWRVLEEPELLRSADRTVLRHQYDSSLRYLDERLRELIGMLEERGMLDDTLVVVTSDHGEYLDTHGMWSHLFGVFNDLTHVTLIVREPGRRQALRVGTPVQLSDIRSTVLRAALDAKIPESLYGPRDLLQLAAAGGEPRIAISEAGEIGAAAMLGGGEQRLRLGQPELAAQDGRFKLVLPETGRPRLYDLQTDPQERNDVAGRRPAVTKRLRDHVRLFESSVPAPLVDETVDIDPLLQALGYAEE
jgi:arylsulfatase A-like enzyme